MQEAIDCSIDIPALRDNLARPVVERLLRHQIAPDWMRLQEAERL